MKNIFKFVAVLLLSSACSFLAFSEDREPDWQPIPGLMVAGISQVYIDEKNLSVGPEDVNPRISNGQILIVFPRPLAVDTKDGIKYAKSIVSGYVVNCSEHQLLLVYDLLFDVEHPKIEDRAILKREHKDHNPEEVSKNDKILQAFCPRYI